MVFQFRAKSSRSLNLQRHQAARITNVPPPHVFYILVNLCRTEIGMDETLMRLGEATLLSNSSSPWWTHNFHLYIQLNLVDKLIKKTLLQRVSWWNLSNGNGDVKEPMTGSVIQQEAATCRIRGAAELKWTLVDSAYQLKH